VPHLPDTLGGFTVCRFVDAADSVLGRFPDPPGGIARFGEDPLGFLSLTPGRPKARG
jgi:hypothetical protein